ncbi:MAG: DegV family protein [Coriobacteriia bacterium]|nr:DegV family protein [Coriobacteriia bacterium]
MTRIIIDSAADYGMAAAAEKGMKVAPLTYLIEGNSYTDGVDLTSDEFFEMLERTGAFGQTSQVTPQGAIEAMTAARDEAPGEDLVCIALSSVLSGTHDSFCVAADAIDPEHIHVIDSLTATAGSRILIDEALRLADEGVPAAEIAEQIRALVPRIRIFACLDTLEYLKRSGRIPATAAAVGDRAKLKPVIEVYGDRGVTVMGATLGASRAVSSVAKRFKEVGFDSRYPRYSIWSYGTENVELLEKKLAKDGAPVTGRYQIGPVIGTHIGPGACGICFVQPE